jgi:thymidine phosphorylase
MAVVGRVESDIDVGRSRAAALLDSGAALERFGEMVRRQKGDSSVLDGAYGWTLARQTREFTLGQSGTVTSMDSQAIGQAIVALGGGRRRMEDRVDPGVGLLVHAKTGEGVGPSTPVATVYYNDDASLEQALLFLRKGWALGEAGCQPELIKEGREWN